MDYRKRIYEHYATNFQNVGCIYDKRARKRWGRAYQYYLRSWLPHDKDAQIVDVACGRGHLLHFFREEGYQSTCGVDISPEQVSLARQVVPNVTEQDAIAFLETHCGMFDLVAGLDIIEHFHKPEVMRFLDACYAALRPQGRLILQTPNMDSPWGTVHRYGDFSHEIGFNVNSLTQLMRLTRFDRVQARELGPVPLGYSVASTARYLVWQTIRAGLKLWNLAETGDPGSGVFTRVFLISGVKK